MANTLADTLAAKLASGPRPGPLRIDRSLGQMPDHKALKKAHEMKELDETLADLKARGIRATVVVEAD